VAVAFFYIHAIQHLENPRNRLISKDILDLARRLLILVQPHKSLRSMQL